MSANGAAPHAPRQSGAYYRRQRQENGTVEKARLRAELLAHYGDLGPQYRILVERLVQAHVRAGVADRRQDPLRAAEQREQAEHVLKCVAALQRYTEALKAEVIQKKIELQVVRVVEIIEAVVLPVAPQLWNEVIAALAERAPSLE